MSIPQPDPVKEDRKLTVSVPPNPRLNGENALVLLARLFSKVPFGVVLGRYAHISIVKLPDPKSNAALLGTVRKPPLNEELPAPPGAYPV
jgi:hypothetical protein